MMQLFKSKAASLADHHRLLVFLHCRRRCNIWLLVPCHAASGCLTPLVCAVLLSATCASVLSSWRLLVVLADRGVLVE